jgi:dodecin
LDVRWERKTLIGVTALEDAMGTVARVTEISATSDKSFEDAIAVGITRADETLRKIRSAWVKEQEVRVADGKVAEYQVNMLVTFELDE